MASGTKESNRTYFQTCKEKGADDGWPYFGRYLKTAPDPIPEGMVIDTYEKKGKRHNYEKKDWVSGYLKRIMTEEKEIVGKKVKDLSVILGDETSSATYKVTLGTVKSAYSRQLLQRLCNPALKPDDPIRLSLYQFSKDDGTKGTALSVKQGETSIGIKGADGNKLPYIVGMPEGIPMVVNDEKVTDFKDQINWLFKTVMERLPADVFSKEPIPAPATPEAPSSNENFPTQAPPVQNTPPPITPDDDSALPF